MTVGTPTTDWLYQQSAQFLVDDVLGGVPVPLVVLRANGEEMFYQNPAFQEQFSDAQQDSLRAALRSHLATNKAFEGIRLEIDGQIYLADGKPSKMGRQKASIVTLYPARLNDELAQQQLEQYQTLAGFISDFTYHYQVLPDSSLKLVWISEKFVKVTGYRLYEMSPLEQTDEFVHPEDRYIIQQQLRSVLNGSREVAEFRFLTKQGRTHWLRNHMFPIKEGDKIIRIYGMGQDITAHKLAEEALLYGTARDIAFRKDAEAKLRQYATQLESINQELDAYGHTIAHDLKSPLAGIIGYIELLEYTLTTKPERAETYISRIRESSEVMVKMVNQLLWMARLRNAEENLKELEVKPLLEGVMKRFESQLENDKVTLKVAESFPNIMGHMPWVEEVFANLISNSIKYIGEDNPQPTIEINAEEQGDMVRFTVTDNGIGIAPEDQDRLFEEFARAKDVKQEGHGLGLSIVSRIVNKLNGEIGVESELGKGSTFWFTLPKP